MPPARKLVPERKGLRRSPHRPADPALIREKGGIGWGGLLVGGAGTAFVAYVWNAGGLQTYLDGTFGGFNRSLHTHDELVARGYLAALPVLGMALAVVVVYAMLASVAGKVKKAGKRRRKARSLPAAAALATQPASLTVLSAEFVRPIRLVGARDESVLVKTER